MVNMGVILVAILVTATTLQHEKTQVMAILVTATTLQLMKKHKSEKPGNLVRLQLPYTLMSIPIR